MREAVCERVEAVLPDESTYQSAYAELPEWRRRKCEACRLAADRYRSVAAWELLRRLLVEKGIRAEALSVTEGEFGKPAFDPSLGIHFSLSHAGDRVMAAVDGHPVGCDVERIVPFDEAVARECLTDDELEHVGRLPPGSARDRAFTGLWVRKEAYVKALGRGFGIEPKSVCVLAGKFPSGWCVRDLDFADGYLGCVVCKGGPDCRSVAPTCVMI